MKTFNILQLFAGEGGGAGEGGVGSGEGAAGQKGQSVDAQAPQSGQPEAQQTDTLAQRLAALDRAREEEFVRRHFQSMEQQAQQLRQLRPDFDLRSELRDPMFAKLVSPSVGLGVREAYCALHFQQLQDQAMEVTARKTAQKLTNALRSGQLRPQENGTAPQGASLTAFDSRRATPAQRQALKQRIRQAAARGEKLYPGE